MRMEQRTQRRPRVRELCDVAALARRGDGGEATPKIQRRAETVRRDAASTKGLTPSERRLGMQAEILSLRAGE